MAKEPARRYASAGRSGGGPAPLPGRRADPGPARSAGWTRPGAGVAATPCWRPPAAPRQLLCWLVPSCRCYSLCTRRVPLSARARMPTTCAKEKQVSDALEREKEIGADLRQQKEENTKALTESEERGQKLREEVAARHKLLNQSARMARRHGLDLCNGGQTAQGVLWLARALELAPEEDRDLQQTLRADLAHWQREMPSLRRLMRPGAASHSPGRWPRRDPFSIRISCGSMICIRTSRSAPRSGGTLRTRPCRRTREALARMASGSCSYRARRCASGTWPLPLSPPSFWPTTPM